MPLPLLALSLLLAAPVAEPPAALPDPAEESAPDPWAALRFLVGTWRAESGGGKPGEAVGGGFDFAIDLDGKVAVRRSRSEYAPRAGETKGLLHEDLMVVYPRGDGLQALYWDNEGHVIRYVVRSKAGTVHFESEKGARGPRFRIVYARRGTDEVEVSFSIAPPGKGFQPYVTGVARRVPERSAGPLPGSVPAPTPPAAGR
jgi:hypothetical protein